MSLAISLFSMQDPITTRNWSQSSSQQWPHFNILRGDLKGILCTIPYCKYLPSMLELGLIFKHTYLCQSQFFGTLKDTPLKHSKKKIRGKCERKRNRKEKQQPKYAPNTTVSGSVEHTSLSYYSHKSFWGPYKFKKKTLLIQEKHDMKNNAKLTQFIMKFCSWY